VTDDVAAALQAISTLPSVTLGIISGRRLAEVSRLTGTAARFVAGLHGLEIAGPGAGYRHPALDRVAAAVAELKREAAHQLAWCPGVHLEDKTYALTCHVRLVPPDSAPRVLEQFADLARAFVEAGVLRPLAGRKILELLPAAEWHKGHAALWIRERVEARTGERPAVVYIGDDRTDEDAFVTLGEDAIRIGVGLRPQAQLIDWRLADPPAVGRWLAALARERTSARG
jgi:trehalose-phosphatase